MNRITARFTVPDTAKFKMQMLNWANRFNICSFLDNHQYHSNHHTVECLAAADAVEVFSPATQILTAFSSFLAKQQDWLLGHICYDLKNEIEGLQSAHPDFIGCTVLQIPFNGSLDGLGKQCITFLLEVAFGTGAKQIFIV